MNKQEVPSSNFKPMKRSFVLITILLGLTANVVWAQCDFSGTLSSFYDCSGLGTVDLRVCSGTFPNAPFHLVSGSTFYNGLAGGPLGACDSSVTWTGIPAGFYTLRVNGTVCSSYTVDVIVPTSTIGISASSSPMLCFGQEITLTGTGGSNYSWTSNLGGAWTGTSITVTPSETTTYTVTGLKTGCSSTYGSDNLEVTVSPPLNQGSIQGNQTICYATDVSEFSSIANASGGNGGYSYQWEMRTPGGAWSNISDAIGATYDHGSLTSDQEFRRAASSCGQTAHTSAITVTVDALSVGGTPGPAAEVYGAISGSLSLTGKTGSVQKWQKKPAGGDWTDITNTSTSLSYTNLTISTTYRAWVKNGVCDPIASSEVTLTIHPVPSFQIQGSDAIAGGDSTLLVTDPGYHNYEWYRNNQLIVGESLHELIVKRPGAYKVKIRATSSSPFYTTGELIISDALEKQAMNYIISIDFLKEGVTNQTDIFDLTASDFRQAIQYFDGLGRQIQSVILGESPTGRDVVQPVIYDEFGREAIKYLPYTRQMRDGRYVDNALSEQSTFYQTSGTVANDQYPFAKTVFESSPLNRILKQGAPGETWQPNSDPSSLEDKTVKHKYETNAEEEVYHFAYDITTGLVDLSNNFNERFYLPNALNANKTLDEHNNEVIEFIDKEGRTVCRKAQYGTEGSSPEIVKLYASTYYIYDDLGNLVIVLPPEATNKFIELSNQN